MTIKSEILFFSIGLLTFTVYVRTLAPTITWRNDGLDSGDLATAVAVGGVPHPPGYPTYLILAELFEYLPFGDIAYRLNILSAVCATLTVMIIAAVLYQILSTAPLSLSSTRVATNNNATQQQGFIGCCAVSAALALAFSDLFWSQAVIAEVYALNAFFAAVLLYVALQIRPANKRWLAPTFFCLLGLSLGNHPSILLFLPVPFSILAVRWQWRLIVAGVLAFCVGLLPYSIIPIRAATFPPLNWGGATNWAGFVWLVSATPYRQFLFSLPWEFVPARTVFVVRLLGESFLWWGIPVGFLGFRRLLEHNRSLTRGFLVAFLLISGYAIWYDTTDSYVYLLPIWLIVSVWIGWGLYELANLVQGLRVSYPAKRQTIVLGIAFLPLLSLTLNFSEQDLSRDDDAIVYAETSLQTVAANAIIVTDSDARTFALWYGHYALGLRPDVAIINSHLLTYPWYQQTLRQTYSRLIISEQTDQLAAFVQDNFSTFPIYFSMYEPPELVGYRLVPSSHLHRIVVAAGN